MLKKNIYLSFIIASISSTASFAIEPIEPDVSVTSSTALSSPLGDWYNQTQKYPSNSPNWGNWSDWTFCPVDMYVSGFKIKVEENQGGNRDDTALNRVSLVGNYLFETWMF